jgi:hypothetical protein
MEVVRSKEAMMMMLRGKLRIRVARGTNEAQQPSAASDHHRCQYSVFLIYFPYCLLKLYRKKIRMIQIVA